MFYFFFDLLFWPPLYDSYSFFAFGALLMRITPHGGKIMVAPAATASIFIQQIWFCPYSFSCHGQFLGYVQITWFQIVPVLHCHLFKNFNLVDVQLQLGFHVVSDKCKSQLVSWVKSLQLIEYKTGEQITAQFMLPQGQCTVWHICNYTWFLINNLDQGSKHNCKSAKKVNHKW